MRRVWSLIGAMAVALCAGAAMAQAQDQSNAENNALGIEPQSTACTHSFGSGDLVWCINEHGNLVQFESPATAEHIRVGGIQEGYIVCAGDTNYVDIGLSESGWGAATALRTGANSVTIRRVTTDARFQLDQKWTRNKIRRDLTVMMTLRNLGPPQNVRLMRNADIDADGDFPDDQWDQSAHAGWVRDVNGITMSSLTLAVPHAIVIDAPSQIHSTCSPTSPVPSPGGPGDPGVSVIYDLGNMPTGSRKVVKVNYRAQ